MSNKRETINPKKETSVGALTETLSNAKSIALVDYAGMGVKTQQELKAKLSEVGGAMFVAKNTLLRLAGERAKLPTEMLGQVLEGQTAVVTSNDDAVSPIQILGKFIEGSETPKFKAGVIEGIFQDKDGLIRVSKMPSKLQLSAQVLGAVMAPMYGIVGVLSGNMQRLVFILSEASKKQNAESASV
ncbi:50S ribosomal protein L10 [Candidatus Woesebacteria bacterium RIFOXYB1_FULL_38_16]|uniref:Large ribosomal subunit protein uL10 n=1 Tax=Candidatus Woesebacteria bacterium RIFOXYB1_FULL_38_16 TaxID=1802538 RepID=A0A1F8CTN3_9BACT|nr:MAG: 50S ribosomal protein L10 [Candidatus Woesebacteria bacterium RIFOXYA1_FULL_38_9]OGM79642.1 MAG: 50S ribosomal protein L10 [Candidatus Woesebacteria bacterium RIFOXYB1_FULL_38_16]